MGVADAPRCGSRLRPGAQSKQRPQREPEVAYLARELALVVDVVVLFVVSEGFAQLGRGRELARLELLPGGGLKRLAYRLGGQRLAVAAGGGGRSVRAEVGNSVPPFRVAKEDDVPAAQPVASPSRCDYLVLA